MAMPAIIPNISIGQNAELPPQPARRFPAPTFSPCTIESRWLSDEHGDNTAPSTTIVETQSGRTWLVQREIATAIFGAVYRAVEVKIEDEARYVKQYDENGRTRRVAVKKMCRRKIDDMARSGGENPMNEIAALGIVSEPGHPHVLPLEAALYDGGNVYLLSPFVDGGDVFDWITANSMDPYNEARTNTIRRIFRQLMQGLKYTHSKGICHADMSLENALVDMQRGNAYIIDYGMSLLMPVTLADDGQYRRCKSVADGRRAKISYCSPETFKKKDYDGVKVDVFAAGAMLFMMLTRHITFAKPSRTYRRFKQLVCEGNVAEVICQLRVPPIGDQAVDLLKKMMTYNPEDRPLPDEVLQHPWLTA